MSKGALVGNPSTNFLPNFSNFTNILDTNPISSTFEIGKFLGFSGLENAWKIYEGIRRQDAKEVSIFIFEKRTAEKLHKPRRKETITEILRSSVRQLERFRHPRILQIVAGLEECGETLAFAAEPLRGSLNNMINTNFLDIELKYGFLQITEAIQYLHYNARVIHRNVCPSNIYVNKRGVWKLAGLEFVERCSDDETPIPTIAWTSRLPKMGQPSLDFIAPEIQKTSTCSTASDCFSLGLVIGSVFNGENLIQANHSSSTYLKQIEALDSILGLLLPKVPIQLQEALLRLLNKDPRARPSSQLLALIKYFSDPAIQALQFLDVISMKDPTQKATFYRGQLMDAIGIIPRKLWFTNIWPALQLEMRTQEVLAAVLQPILFLIKESTKEEFDLILLPTFRFVFNQPKSIQATVTLLENLDVILDKSEDESLKEEVLPMLFSSFSSTTIQVQQSALISTSLIGSHLDENSIKKIIIPRTKAIYQQQISTITTTPCTPSTIAQDNQLILSVLKCIDAILPKLDRQSIIEDVLPILYEVKLTDPDIVIQVVQIYRKMLLEKRQGLSINLIATRVLPSLVPQTVNPSLSLEQFSILISTLQELLDSIDRNQRNKLKLDHLTVIPIVKTNLRHQRSSELICSSQVKIDSRKTSSAEDMIKRNDTPPGGLCVNPTQGNSGGDSLNFLRVSPQTPYRRLSDNTMISNTLRVPTSTSINCDDTNLPTRRHSSIGPEGRKNSVAQVVEKAKQPTSASASAVNSRRSSVFQPGILQQIGTGVYQLFTQTGTSSSSK